MRDSSYVLSCPQCEIFVIRDPADKDKLVKNNLDRSLELAVHRNHICGAADLRPTEHQGARMLKKINIVAD